jgi:recombinational DNA repair protein RecR
MVVETSADVLSMERAMPFNGLYHVLHGSISPVNGISYIQRNALVGKAVKITRLSRDS